MLGNDINLVGDEVAQIHVHLHNNYINQLGPVQCDVRSVGGGDQVGVRKNTPCLSECGHVLPEDLQRLTISIKLESPPWDAKLNSQLLRIRPQECKSRVS